MPRISHWARRTCRATVAAVLLPAILLLQLSCECAPAHAASAAHVRAAAHGCCSGGGHQQAPAPQNHQQDHQQACGHCHLTLATSGGSQVSASRVAAWSGLFTPTPRVHVGAPRSVSLVSLTADRIAFETSRLRTCVLLL
jgi:hypothetical protein